MIHIFLYYNCLKEVFCNGAGRGEKELICYTNYSRYDHRDLFQIDFCVVLSFFLISPPNPSPPLLFSLVLSLLFSNLLSFLPLPFYFPLLSPLFPPFFSTSFSSLFSFFLSSLLLSFPLLFSLPPSSTLLPSSLSSLFHRLF